LAARGPDLPRVRVAALLVDDEGRVVLVRHRRGPAVYHLLPGGGVEARETLAEALEREALEETGLEIEVGAPILLNDTLDPRPGGRHIVNITFAARITGGAVTDDPVDDRVEAVELVAPASLGDLDLRPPLAGPLAECLEQGCRGPARYLGPLWAPESDEDRPDR
jgi:ADP-ribose pyrophosphatase YjhB (NUDIX family)